MDGVGSCVGRWVKGLVGCSVCHEHEVARRADAAGSGTDCSKAGGVA